MSTGLKSVKGGKTEDEFDHQTIKLRGVEYAIRELDVTEYKQALKAATKEDGSTPFADLLDILVMRCVTPSPATRTKPMPYPVYRTLEDMVNIMHFRTLPDENAAADETPEGDDKDAEGEPPNS